LCCTKVGDCEREQRKDHGHRNDPAVADTVAKLLGGNDHDLRKFYHGWKPLISATESIEITTTPTISVSSVSSVADLSFIMPHTPETRLPAKVPARRYRRS